MKQVFSILLCMALVLTTLPMAAFAAQDSGAQPTLSIGASGGITGFEALAPDIAARSVPLGTSQASLELLDTLTVTIRLAALETDEEAVSSPSDAEETGGSSEPLTVPLHVTWVSAPEYDGETAGTYLFAPGLPEGFAPMDGAELPIITVTVNTPEITDTVSATAITGTVTAFDPLPDDIRWQNTVVPNFPGTVGGTVDGQAAEIPVTWEADHDYDAETPQRGLYVFTAVLGEGYAPADSVEPLLITVYIPRTGGGTNDSSLEITTAAQLAEIAALVNARPNGLELFLFNSEDARVSLELANVNITGITHTDGVAGVVSHGGTVQHCHVTGTVGGGGKYIGGVAGYVNAGTLQNCAALNPLISGSSEIGCVAGKIYYGTCSGNIVFDGMTDPGTSKFGTITSDGSNKNGVGRTISEISAADFCETLFANDAAWTYQAGKLPILKGLAGQGGDGELYLTARDILYATVMPDATSFTYNGSEQIPALTVTFDSQTLMKGKDYTAAITSVDGPATSAGINIGTVTLTLTGEGDFSGTQALTYTIAKKPVTIMPDSGQGKVYGAADPALTFGNNGGLTSGAFTGTLSRASGETVGSRPISLGNLSAGGNYALSLTPGTVNFNIEPREIALVANNKTIAKGSSLPALTYTISNLAPGETGADALSSEPALDCPDFDGNRLVSYPITLIGGTATGNYIIAARSNGILNVVEQTHAVTFNLNGGARTGGGELTQAVAEGGMATAPDVTRIGYTFTGWDKAFTNVTSDLIVTANWRSNSDDGRSDDGGLSTTPTVLEKKSGQPVTDSEDIMATTGANGTAIASIPDKTITDAIAKAKMQTRARGSTPTGISIGLNIAMPQGATSLALTLTPSSLRSLVNARVSRLEINGAPFSLSLDLNALREILKQSNGNGNISITIAPATELSKAAKALLGDRPVYNITISYADKNEMARNISSLGSGTATLSIPYAPGKNEAVDYLFGVYADGKGNATRVYGSAYDPNGGNLLIPTDHFSVYGVGYQAPSAKFTDIGSHWAKESIDYVVGRGLLDGTSKTTFAPDEAMTRGMLVTALGRLAGVDVKAYTTNSFTDVKAARVSRSYIEWAFKKGIISGIGGGKFAPDRAVTREEIAVILQNYAKATGYKLPVTRNAAAYADASGIGSMYQPAVTAMQQAGIMMGGTGNRFNPKASVTHAEVSSMLHRYIKLTIDPATAQGWALNDAGQWLYYKDGKALTGTQAIDSVKYFFNADGTLKTGWIKDGGEWRYYLGNKLLVGWWDIGSGSAKKTYYFIKDGLMVSDKWLQLDGKWYYFYADGVLAKNTTIDGYEVDENGARKNK